jgi:hypothetical protein
MGVANDSDFDDSDDEREKKLTKKLARQKAKAATSPNPFQPTMLPSKPLMPPPLKAPLTLKMPPAKNEPRKTSVQERMKSAAMFNIFNLKAFLLSRRNSVFTVALSLLDRLKSTAATSLGCLTR